MGSASVMMIQSLAEFLELYDFMKKYAKNDPLLKDGKFLRPFLQERTTSKTYSILKDKRGIRGVAFYWPVSEMPMSDGVPDVDLDGEYLYCHYCFTKDKNRSKINGLVARGGLMQSFIKQALEQYLNIHTIVYRRTKQGGRLHAWKVRTQAAVQGELVHG